MRYRSILTALALVVSLCSVVRAQALADRVPEDSLLYIGWRGAGDLGQGYEGTHLQAIIRDSKLPQLFSQFLPQFFDKISQKEPESKAGLDVLRALSDAAFRHPTAFFVETLDTTDPEHPQPRLGVLCRAGADAPKLQKLLSDAIAKGKPSPVPVHVTTVDDVVALLVNYPDAATALAGGTSTVKPLGNSAAFVNALKQVQQDAVAVVYFDADKLLRLIDDLAAANPDQTAHEVYLRVREASGLSGLKRIILSAGFDQADWGTRLFIEAPAPRTGLLSLLNVQPVPADLLKTVPENAAFMATMKVDPARFITELRNITGKIDPSVQQQFDQGLGAAQMVIGRNLVTEIFEPLGEDWAFYSSPDVAGNSLLGTVMVNKLDDPAKAQQGINALTAFISNGVTAQSRKDDVYLSLRNVRIGDVSISYFGTPIITPSWTIRDGYLFAGLYPQNVAAAVAAKDAIAGGKHSILDSPKYQALQKRLGVEQSVAVQFTDLPTVAPQGYSNLLMISRLFGFGDMMGLNVPEPLIPPLHVLMPHLSPAGSAVWVDDAGMHARTVSPFPGSTLLLEQQSTMLSSNAMMISILLPSLNRARETANRVKSAANLRQIGQGILLHSNEHQGQYPPDLGTLMTTQSLTPDVFLSPRTDSKLPNNLQPAQVSNWVSANSDYVYLGAGKTIRSPANEILVYERPDRVEGGINVLYGDGSVEFLFMEQARQRLQQQGVTENLP